jgi:glycosyltransferase involved in cell wall biosynthesis
MKVGIEVHHACVPTPRGIAYYVSNIVRAMLKRGNHSYTLTFYDKNKERGNRSYFDNQFGSYIDVSKVGINECNNVSFAELLRPDIDVIKNALYNDYTNMDADVIHFPNLFPLPTKLRGKAVVTVHDLIPILYPELTDAYTTWNSLYAFKRLMELSPLIIADSESTKNDIIKYSGIQEKQICVIHGSFDPEECYPEHNESVLRELGIDSEFLLYFGPTDDHRKGVSYVLAAFLALSDKYPNLKLVAAGSRTTAESVISRTVAKLPELLKKRIVDLGYVTSQQKRVLLSSASVFTFPSMYEGFGLPVIEALACGVPVITTNISSLPEVGGIAALYIEPGDVSQLSCHMDSLLSSKSMRDEYISHGFEHASKFSWDIAAAKTEEVYEKAYRSLV